MTHFEIAGKLQQVEKEVESEVLHLDSLIEYLELVFLFLCFVFQIVGFSS